MPELLQKTIQKPLSKDNRLEKIRAVVVEKSNSLQTLLDNSYAITANSKNLISLSIKRFNMRHNIKNIVREKEILATLNKSAKNDTEILKRNNIDVLESIFNIVNSKDKNGNTPIMKAIKNDDIDTLNYLLNKITTKIDIYNNVSVNRKIYLHNILDTKNNENKTALHIAAESNIKCYNLILDYMKKVYSDNKKYDFVANNFKEADRKKIKDALYSSEKLIKDSFSLAFYFNKDKKELLPSVDKLKSNLINANISDAKEQLNNLFNNAMSTNKSISKRELRNALNSNKLCDKLDINSSYTPDILLSRFKILTDVNPTTGLTPIMQATKNNDYKTLSLLVKEVEYIKKSYYECCDKPLINYLDVTDKNYNTALSYAIKNNSYKCADLLLKAGTTLGSDIEYTKCDSYVMQAIKVHDYSILDLIAKSFKRSNGDRESLKNYLSLTNANSHYVSPIGLAIESGDLACAFILDERYNVNIPEQHKNAYANLKITNKDVMYIDDVRNSNVITKIFRNIVNSIISLLSFLGIIQVKNTQQA